MLAIATAANRRHSRLLQGMHMPFDLSARLAERQAADLFRQRPLLQSPQGPLVQVDG